MAEPSLLIEEDVEILIEQMVGANVRRHFLVGRLQMRHQSLEWGFVYGHRFVLSLNRHTYRLRVMTLTPPPHPLDVWLREEPKVPLTWREVWRRQAREMALHVLDALPRTLDVHVRRALARQLALTYVDERWRK